MPLHLILIMLAALALMLWLAFQDGGDAELEALLEDQDAADDAAARPAAA
jgi:hypothetical protein